MGRVFGREWFDESLGMLVFVVEEADGDVRVFFQKEVFSGVNGGSFGNLATLVGERVPAYSAGPS